MILLTCYASSTQQPQWQVVVLVLCTMVCEWCKQCALVLAIHVAVLQQRPQIWCYPNTPFFFNSTTTTLSATVTMACWETVEQYRTLIIHCDYYSYLFQLYNHDWWLNGMCCTLDVRYGHRREQRLLNGLYCVVLVTCRILSIQISGFTVKNWKII